MCQAFVQSKRLDVLTDILHTTRSDLADSKIIYRSTKDHHKFLYSSLISKHTLRRRLFHPAVRKILWCDWHANRHPDMES